MTDIPKLRQEIPINKEIVKEYIKFIDKYDRQRENKSRD